MNYIEALRKAQEKSKAYSHQTFAGALKGSASGSAILLPDVSPVEHEMGVKVRSKNLFPLYEGVYTFLGYQNGHGIFPTHKQDVTHLRGKTIVYSADFDLTNALEDTANAATALWIYDTEGKYIFVGNGNRLTKGAKGTSTLVYTIADNAVYLGIGVAVYYNGRENPIDSSVITVSNFRVALGTKEAPYTPYVADLSGVGLKRQGKNLFDNEKFAKTENYPFSRDATYIYTDEIQLAPNTAYTMKATNDVQLEKGIYCVVWFSRTWSNYFLEYPIHDGENKTITFTTDNSGIMRFGVNTKITPENLFSQTLFQIEVGETATPYEPYIEPTTYTVNEDGTVDGVTPIYPNTTLLTDTSGTVIECEYNRDLNKAFEELTQAIISLGGEV